jgi:hypothetical protein
MAWLHAALPWLVGLGLAGLLAIVVAQWPLRLEASGRARGEADGGWAVACGVSISVVSVALVWARGTAPQLSMLAFGRKLRWKQDWTRKLTRPVPKPVKRASRRAWARVDALGLGLKLLEERRHLRVRRFALDLKYGFQDPLLTGRLVGALSVLAAVLPPPIELRQTPRWDLEDGWEASLDARAVLKPWLILLDTLIYVVRKAASRTTPEPRALAAQGPNQVPTHEHQ